ncbi:DUF759 family protein, partial [Borrelia persica]|uniref:DUF759 family protein n=1 Tax=Borrelia persica TaxID=44448 RepID=UPI0004645B6C
DLRKEEYESLAKKNKFISKVASNVKDISRIAAGTAIGNIISTSFQGGLGDIMNFAKKSIQTDAMVSKISAVTSQIFKTHEKNAINSILDSMSGFARSIDKEDFLNYAGVIRKKLEFLGQNNHQNLTQAVSFAAKLKSTGVVKDNATA